MSKKFNPYDYTKDVWMCCRTEEESKDFCRVLHEAGKTWASGDSYLDLNVWSITHDRVFYNFTTDSFIYDSCIERNPRFTILYWSDFIDKEFTKDDLRNGDVVLRRNRNAEIYIQGRFVDDEGNAYYAHYINDDLSTVHHNSSRYDIMAVRRPDDISDMSFDAFEKKLGHLVYERDETVEMTIEEVCKALGKNVKIVKE